MGGRNLSARLCAAGGKWRWVRLGGRGDPLWPTARSAGPRKRVYPDQAGPIGPLPRRSRNLVPEAGRPAEHSRRWCRAGVAGDWACRRKQVCRCPRLGRGLAWNGAGSGPGTIARRHSRRSRRAPAWARATRRPEAALLQRICEAKAKRHQASCRAADPQGKVIELQTSLDATAPGTAEQQKNGPGKACVQNKPPRHGDRGGVFGYPGGGYRGS
jgi:hypothetical protein